jgi:hypothetical protein
MSYVIYNKIYMKWQNMWPTHINLTKLLGSLMLLKIIIVYDLSYRITRLHFIYLKSLLFRICNSRVGNEDCFYPKCQWRNVTVTLRIPRLYVLGLLFPCFNQETLACDDRVKCLSSESSWKSSEFGNQI